MIVVVAVVVISCDHGKSGEDLGGRDGQPSAAPRTLSVTTSRNRSRRSISITACRNRSRSYASISECAWKAVH